MRANRSRENTVVLDMAQEDGRNVMTIVVTPLNLLGKQNEALLERS
jgi:hypothetical protein